MIKKFFIGVLADTEISNYCYFMRPWFLPADVFVIYWLWSCISA